MQRESQFSHPVNLFRRIGGCFQLRPLLVGCRWKANAAIQSIYFATARMIGTSGCVSGTRGEEGLPCLTPRSSGPRTRAKFRWAHLLLFTPPFETLGTVVTTLSTVIAATIRRISAAEQCFIVKPSRANFYRFGFASSGPCPAQSLVTRYMLRSVALQPLLIFNHLQLTCDRFQGACSVLFIALLNAS